MERNSARSRVFLKLEFNGLNQINSPPGIESGQRQKCRTLLEKPQRVRRSLRRPPVKHLFVFAPPLSSPLIRLRNDSLWRHETQHLRFVVGCPIARPAKDNKHAISGVKPMPATTTVSGASANATSIASALSMGSHPQWERGHGRAAP
jgi:hypothetical protein